MKRRRTIFRIICGIRLAHVITVVDANSHSLRVRTAATESRSGAGGWKWPAIPRVYAGKNRPAPRGLDQRCSLGRLRCMHKPRTPEHVLLAADSGAVLSTVQIRGCSVVGMRTNEARTVVACLGSNLQNMKLMITSAQARVILYIGPTGHRLRCDASSRPIDPAANLRQRRRKLP